MSPTDASTSRGTAMSMMNSGSRRCRPMAASTCARVMIGRCDPVAVTTMSRRDAVLAVVPRHAARPLTVAASVSACAGVRLVMTISPTPCARRCCAVSVLISPAPTTSTRRPSSRPKIFRASATAAKLTDTAPSPSAVSLRTRLPTPNDQWNSLLSIGPVQRVRRGLKRVLHLSEDLRLADDQRVEPGGHAEQMPGGGLVVEREEVRVKLSAAADGTRSGTRRSLRACRRDRRWRRRSRTGCTSTARPTRPRTAAWPAPGRRRRGRGSRSRAVPRTSTGAGR